MFVSPPLLSSPSYSATTSLSMAQATFDPTDNQVNYGNNSATGNRPSMVRKKSGEIVKSALKMAISNHIKDSEKKVKFPATLVRVRSFDKLQCPQSVSGYTPLTIRALNFSSNDHLLEHMPVCLERIERDLEASLIVGTVRVANLDFQKRVVLRYSFDHWSTFHHINAEFYRSVSVCCNTSQDQFQFKLVIPPAIRISSDPDTRHTLKFAIQYLVQGSEYWDNNHGRNYSLEICPAVEIDPRLMEADLEVPPSPDDRPLYMPTLTTTCGLTEDRSRLSGSPELFDPFKHAFKATTPSPAPPHSFAPSHYQQPPKSLLGSRYSFNSSLSKSSSSANGHHHGPGRSVRLEASTSLSAHLKSGLAAPVHDTTVHHHLPSRPIAIPNIVGGSSDAASRYGTSPSAAAGFSCSPVSGFGWAKAQTSWFDSITLDDYSNRSPPVHTT